MSPEFVKPNNKKSKKSDPYKHIRRDSSKPGFVIVSEKDYNRSRERQEIYREVLQWQDEILTMGVEI
jgi:hypothetical protein